MEEDFYEESRKDDNKNSGKIFIIILAIFFLPSLAFGFLYNIIMLRLLRFRLSVIVFLSLPLIFLNALLFYINGGFEPLLGIFSMHWTGVFASLIYVYIFFGIIIGLAFILWNIREMKVNPWRLTHDTNWMYNFSYRRTPFQYFSFKKKQEALRNGDYIRKDFAPLGIDDEGSDMIVGRYESEAIKHMLLTGTPGSGKSITMLSMIHSDIINSVTCFFIDFKRDPELASKLAAWAHENNRPFYHLVNGDPSAYDIPYGRQSCYDPLATGTPTSNADMLLSMREYDSASAVYKASMQQVLQVFLNMVYVVRAKNAYSQVPADWDSGGFFTFASLLNPESIGAMARVCKGTDIEKEAQALWELMTRRSQESHSIEELRGQLRTLTVSEYGRWIKTREGFSTINLLELSLTPGAVVLFSLNSDSEKEFSSYMGSIIMSDLTNISALRRNSGKINNPVHVYIDEFQVVNPTSVAGLLEKSRASNIGVTLAQQSLEQIVASSSINGEAYLNSILDTCGNFIIHNGSVESSALYFSNIIGKVEKQQYSIGRNNESFFGSFNFMNRRKHRVLSNTISDWEKEPRFFMDLDTPTQENNYKTTAILLNKTSSDPSFKGKRGSKARRLLMIPHHRVLEKYYHGNNNKPHVPINNNSLSDTSEFSQESSSSQQLLKETEDRNDNIGTTQHQLPWQNIDKNDERNIKSAPMGIENLPASSSWADFANSIAFQEQKKRVYQETKNNNDSTIEEEPLPDIDLL